MFITVCGSSYSQPQLCGGLVSRMNVRVSILYFYVEILLISSFFFSFLAEMMSQNEVAIMGFCYTVVNFYVTLNLKR